MASASVSAHCAAVVIITLSFTNAPTGSAFEMAFLYAASTGLSPSKSCTENPSTPRPLSALISQLDVLPAAYHIAGCGLTYGFGRILRGGSAQYLPSYPSYSSCIHILANSPITSSQISRVTDVSVMPSL